eukprot:4957212-Amphidinium_carterae.1
MRATDEHAPTKDPKAWLHVFAEGWRATYNNMICSTIRGACPRTCATTLSPKHCGYYIGWASLSMLKSISSVITSSCTVRRYGATIEVQRFPCSEDISYLMKLKGFIGKA